MYWYPAENLPTVKRDFDDERRKKASALSSGPSNEIFPRSFLGAPGSINSAIAAATSKAVIINNTIPTYAVNMHDIRCHRHIPTVSLNQPRVRALFTVGEASRRLH